jgi:hypothetical protein
VGIGVQVRCSAAGRTSARTHPRSNGRVNVIKVVGSEPCESIHVEADPWIPLKVSWQLEVPTGLLNLYVRGVNGGYVEIRVDARTGAIVEVVVIEIPPDSSVRYSMPSDPSEVGVPTLDREIWERRVTPDYNEPANRDASIEQELSYSTSESSVARLFAESRGI